jgi:hypothetical protein
VLIQTVSTKGFTPEIVANLWTEFAAQHSEALATNGKELQNPGFSSVAATFEKAITYVSAGRLIRNAEVRGSTPLCSTKESRTYGRAATLPFSFVTDSSLGPNGFAKFSTARRFASSVECVYRRAIRTSDHPKISANANASAPAHF